MVRFTNCAETPERPSDSYTCSPYKSVFILAYNISGLVNKMDKYVYREAY